MSLPYELIDEILGYLPLGDRKSLQAYSLVAKPWVSPAQSRLFSSVVIIEDDHQSWKDTISPTNTDLLNHVRSLSFATALPVPGWKPLPIDDFFNYLTSFHHLQRLALCDARIKSDISQQLEAFSVFQNSLSSLAFHAPFLTWSAFIAIIDYFPGVRDLKVVQPIWDIDHQQASPLSRPLRGKLSIEAWDYQALSVFSDQLSGLEVEYDELAILGFLGPGLSATHHQHIINACGKSLKRLRLSQCASEHPLTLEHCPELSCLEIHATSKTGAFTIDPRQSEYATISSIASINLRTITFLSGTYYFTSHDAVNRRRRDHLDGIVCALVHTLRTLGYKHTLELEFRAQPAKFDPTLDSTGFLPRFKESGLVRILNTLSGEVVDLP